MTADLLAASWDADGGPGGAAVRLPAGFEVAYAGPDGREVRAGLDRLRCAELEACRPVRSFPSYRGQRNYPGWYWSATMARRVGFESWVERGHLVALDFDPAVTAIVSQPFWLSWRTPAGKARRHAPDFFARLAGGGALVVDSRPRDAADESDREAFAATRKACDVLGWGYAVCGAMDPVVAANHRWIAGYRHPRCGEPATEARLLEAFGPGLGLMEGAEAAGDPLATLPALFHLMWRRELTADLTVVLSDRTVVRRTGRG
ncbi:MAG: TnsA-like heteromeric transposase endonuclease subunit [Streptosporangiaceae bacterium]